MTSTAKRSLRIILPFEDKDAGGRIGVVRIAVEGGETADYYVTTDADNKDAVTFFKDGGDNSVHAVDLDMGCCDCKAHYRWKKCRHAGAAKKLRELGHI